jgi:restriction system protein
MKGNDKIAVQAKRYSDKVGLHAVQEVVGAMAHYQCNIAIVVTNNYFTRACKKLAKSNDVSLWNREELIEEIIS